MPLIIGAGDQRRVILAEAARGAYQALERRRYQPTDTELVNAAFRIKKPRFKVQPRGSTIALIVRDEAGFRAICDHIAKLKRQATDLELVKWKQCRAGRS